MSSAPGAFLVDVFPLLRYIPRWMPGASFQKTAREWKNYLEDTANIPFNLVKERMVCDQCSYNTALLNCVGRPYKYSELCLRPPGN